MKSRGRLRKIPWQPKQEAMVLRRRSQMVAARSSKLLLAASQAPLEAAHHHHALRLLQKVAQLLALVALRTAARLSDDF
jgi:hypothetical protein